jgi:hypothetical protein
MRTALEFSRYDFIDGTVEDPILNMFVICINQQQEWK